MDDSSTRRDQDGMGNDAAHGRDAETGYQGGSYGRSSGRAGDGDLVAGGGRDDAGAPRRDTTADDRTGTPPHGDPMAGLVADDAGGRHGHADDAALPRGTDEHSGTSGDAVDRDPSADVGRREPGR